MWLTTACAVIALVVGGLIVAPVSATIQVLCKGVSSADVKACNPAYAPEMPKMHWRMYGGHNCTNYLAWQLGVNGVPEPKILMGNAISWGANAKKLGYTVNSTPAVGAVGAWPGKKNHITYVAEVGDGYIITHEDNYPGYYAKGLYQELKIYKGDSSYPPSFIHFKDLISGTKPTVSGTAKVGQTLKGADGSWLPLGVSLAHQWLRDGTAISGATGTSYEATAADVGHALALQVTGTKSGLATSKLVSTATARVIPGVIANIVAPKVTGTTKVGSTLNAVAGTWDPADLDLGYQWLRGGVPVPGATKETYDLGTDDLGTVISVGVTGTKSGYTTLTKTSPATAPIASGTITNSDKPTVSGEAKVGSDLTVQGGSWTPDGTALTYSWHANGTPISGATGKTFVPTTAQTTKTLTVSVTAAKPGFAPTTVDSEATAPVVDEAAPKVITNTVAPTITGGSEIGSWVEVAGGTWSPSGVSFAYQWYRAGKAVSGGTKTRYKLTSADRGKTITVKVTGSKTGLPSLSKTSRATAKVTDPALVVSKTPAITGTPFTGMWIGVDPGTWSPSGVKLSYQWYRSGKAVSGGTRDAYKVTAADLGKTIVVKVTGAKTGYPKLSKSSKATAKITAPIIANTRAPVISGKATVGTWITVDQGSWTPSPVTLTYQWFRAGKAVSGGTKKDYKLTSADRGKTVAVKITGKKSGFPTLSKTSKATATVK